MRKVVVECRIFFAALALSGRSRCALGIDGTGHGEPARPDRATIVAFAQKAAIAAVNFRQGDGIGFTHARVDFTPDGWKDFMKHMEGFLDEKGAPTFTSTYRAAIEVYAVRDLLVHKGAAIKIQHLEQIACAAASADCQ